MKILFIQPSPYGTDCMPIKKKKLYFVGLALPLLAALTPRDWQVEICLETIENVPFDTDAEIIALSGMGHSIIRSIDLAKEFRARGKTVVMGGYMVSLMAEEAGKYCDAVVIGDAELVWSRLLEDYQQGRLQSRYEKKLKKLDPPLPRYDLFPGNALLGVPVRAHHHFRGYINSRLLNPADHGRIPARVGPAFV
ncbi:MAG: hypothetical protein D3906_10065, partial [Candidatus Electrothrix sp. AUS1_2]|nr:hypothetical protein [Candidatus Electrothrix sp. AUS1_2]